MVKLSILGLNNWTDGHVWDQFDVPDNVSRQDVIDSILTECAELSLVYTEPETVKMQIGLWCRKELENWKRIATALSEEYNPIHNYDRFEEWSDNGSTQVSGFNQTPEMADKDSAKSDHKGHIFGNIGVVSSQAMISAELDIRQRYNVIDVILNSFKTTFCVLIY